MTFNFVQITSKLQNLKVQYKNRKITSETTEAQLQVYFLDILFTVKNYFRQLQAKMKAILELEVTMREQAESRAKNTQDHDLTIKKRKIPKIVEAESRKQVQQQQQQQATQRPQRKSVVQQVANIKPEIKTDSQPVKTSVIMSTPEFNQRHKSTPPEPPKLEQTSESVICVNAPRSPDIVKKETIRDPVTDLVEKKSPPENEVKKTTPTKTEKNEVRRPQEKIRLNPFLMDEAVTTLLDMSKT